MANECTVGTINADVSIKIILKMLHQHPRQLPHQHLTLKIKNLSILKIIENIIRNKKKLWNLDLLYLCLVSFSSLFFFFFPLCDSINSFFSLFTKLNIPVFRHKIYIKKFFWNPTNLDQNPNPLAI